MEENSEIKQWISNSKECHHSGPYALREKLSGYLCFKYHTITYCPFDFHLAVDGFKTPQFWSWWSGTSDQCAWVSNLVQAMLHVSYKCIVKVSYYIGSHTVVVNPWSKALCLIGSFVWGKPKIVCKSTVNISQLHAHFLKHLMFFF